jgi:thiol-disulfide isomerase/thioredoxin
MPVTRTLVAALLVAVIGLAAGCDQQPTGASDPAAGPTPPQQTPEPIDLAGLKQRIQQAAANDNVLVVDFWATWCKPCKAMFDDIHALGETHNGQPVVPNVEVISVSFDGDTEGGLTGAQKAGKYLERKPYDAFKGAYIVKNSDVPGQMVKAIGENWQNEVVPAIFVFDKNGNLAGEFIDMGVQQTIDAVQEKAIKLSNDPADQASIDRVATQPEELSEDIEGNDSEGDSAAATQPAGETDLDLPSIEDAADQ